MKLHYVIWLEHGDIWVACCLELCLATQSVTATDAESKLDEQVMFYLEDARTMDGGKHEKQLLNRPAPLTHRLFYTWRRFMEAIGFPDYRAFTMVKLCTGERLVNIKRSILNTPMYR